MPNEHLILNRHPLADEGVRRYLAARSDLGANLDLDKSADAGFIADFTTVEINKVWMEDTDLTAQSNII